MHLAGHQKNLVFLRMAEKLKTALIQADLIWENREANKNQFEEKINVLSPEVDLIVLPEMFSTGFSMNAEPLAEPTGGISLQWMKKMAAEKEAAITGSLIVKEDGEYFNRLYFVFPDGTFEKYDKRHTFSLAKENETYSSGTERLIVTYKDWRICPLVCYDLRFPVWSRNTEDYDLLIYVANWPSVRVQAWDTLLRARAIENMCYCIGLNRVGVDGNGHPYPGHSAVFDSLGNPLNPPSVEEEFEEEVELDKSHISETRRKLRFLQDRDNFSIHI